MSHTLFEGIKTYDDYSNPHFKVFRKYGKFPSNLTIGFENELVYDASDAPKKLNNKVANFMRKNPYLYLKEECSCDGVELNSHPFNWSWFDALMKNSKKKNFISELSSLHTQKHFYVNNACGYHIHLGRKYFSKKHLVKMVKFFYDPKNTKFLFKISRRTRRSFNEWSSPFVPYKYCKVHYTFKELASWSRKKFNDEMVDKASILNLYPKKQLKFVCLKEQPTKFSLKHTLNLH